jgi:hypothetical protein
MAALGKELVLFNNCCSGMVLNELVRLRWMITTIGNRHCLAMMSTFYFYELIAVDLVKVLSDFVVSEGVRFNRFESATLGAIDIIALRKQNLMPTIVAQHQSRVAWLLRILIIATGLSVVGSK